MARFFIRRMLSLVPTLFIIVTLSFFLIRLAPGGPFARERDLPEAIRTAVRNHGGGHANHSLFWPSLKKGGGRPAGELARALETAFGGYDGFQQQFTQAAMGVFGSGWAWLTWDGSRLRIESLPNQDSPLSQGRVPLLGLDVWEHAYYLKYQNRRADYVAAFFGIINWDFVADRYREARA